MVGKRDPGRMERTRRARGVDPRLIIGVVLVIGSVAGVYAVVTAADRSVLVLAAASTVSPGDRIYVGDLRPTSVQLGDAGDEYLQEEDVPDDGLLVTRAVAEGELVPRSAVGAASSIRFASVIVTVRGQLSKSIVPGVVVDLWSSAEAEHGVYGPPVVLVGSATVVRVVESGGIIADQGGGVEVLIPRARIARVLEAVANGDAISLVPVSIPAGR